MQSASLTENRLQYAVVEIRHPGQRRRIVIQDLLTKCSIVKGAYLERPIAVSRFLMSLVLLGMTTPDGVRALR